MATPGTQTAVQVRQYSLENPSAGLAIAEIAVPEPREGEVLVRMLMRPINPADVFSIQGLYPGFQPAQLPAVPGLDGVGRVERSGPGTSGRFKQGQRVVGVPWATKQGSGTWQQYAAAPEGALFPVPDELSDEAASQFVVNPLTVYGFLDVLQVPRGGWLLQNAANSVLGRMLIQLAKHVGVKTVNLVRRREYVDELKALGADEVLVITEEDVAARIKEVTGGKGAYAAVDPVGGEVTAEIAGAVRDQGTLLVFSAMADTKVVINIPDLLWRDVTVRGFWLNSSYLSRLGPRREEVLRDVMDLMVQGVLVPHSGRKYPLLEAKAAVEESMRSGRGGKVLLVG